MSSIELMSRWICHETVLEQGFPSPTSTLSGPMETSFTSTQPWERRPAIPSVANVYSTDPWDYRNGLYQTHQVSGHVWKRSYSFSPILWSAAWRFYVHQLATPATHVSLVKLLNLNHYYVWCLLQGLSGGRWSVCRSKSFPKPIITQRCLTEAHLYPIINSGCLSTWWLCAYLLVQVVPLRHIPTNLAPHCQPGPQDTPFFSSHIYHASSSAQSGVSCLWSWRTSLNTSALLSMLMSLLESTSVLR